MMTTTTTTTTTTNWRRGFVAVYYKGKRSGQITGAILLICRSGEPGREPRAWRGQDETRPGRMGKAQLVFALRRGAELAEVWGLQEVWLCLPVAVRGLNLDEKENPWHLSTDEREEMI